VRGSKCPQCPLPDVGLNPFDFGPLDRTQGRQGKRLQGGDERGQEARRAVVALLQREPGGGTRRSCPAQRGRGGNAPAQSPDPFAEQRRLAKAGVGGGGRQPAGDPWGSLRPALPRQGRIQSLEQTRPRGQLMSNAQNGQFPLQEGMFLHHRASCCTTMGPQRHYRMSPMDCQRECGGCRRSCG
jgi:hypothetical protein